MAKRKSNPSSKKSNSKLSLFELLATLSLSLLLLSLTILHSRSFFSFNPPIVERSANNNKKDARNVFLKWLSDNGAIFHRNVTLDEFPDYGGWGLVLGKEEESQVCPQRDHQHHCDSSFAIVRPLDPLFTIPSKLILSIPSVLESYGSSSSGIRYIPEFRSRLNSILQDNLRGGSGLASRVNEMGLVEQDVVLALFLMTEYCQHNANRQGFFEEDSFWGPYLDVLPLQVGRLDTFGDEEYGVLDDAELERVGRDSLDALQRMYFGANNDDSSASLKGLLLEMIRTKRPKATFQEAECTSFQSFHRFVSLVSSRAMVLRGEKRIVPLAEMMNYAPLPIEKDRIRPSFDLFHTLEKGGMTIRSDRDVLPSEVGGVIQLFEDYGPVDSSLFLEAHGFVPGENPHHCVVIDGTLIVAGIAPDGRKEDELLVRRALKMLGLIHPTEDAPLMQSVCVRRELTMIEDGNIIGRRPASDSIAVASLLIGREDATPLRQLCVRAVESGDIERIELRCARYPGSGESVREALKNAAKAIIGNTPPDGYEEDNDETMNMLRTKLREAEAKRREQLALAYRFRIEERRLLASIAYSTTEQAMENHAVARTAVDSDLQQKLHDFNVFIESLGLPTNKIEPRIAGNGMRIGTYAKEAIEVGDVYLSLPPHAVIDSSTALKDAESSPDLKRLLERYNKRDSDGFMVLLIYLIHERFIMREKSKWWPYLHLLPTVEEMKSFHPLFYQEDDINQHLGGSDVRRVMIRYQQRTAEKHAALSSDLNANLLLDSERLRDKDVFYWASAIIDSRSIWWDGERHLAPLLDLVNADSLGRSHETRMEEAESNDGDFAAVTRASRHIQEGEQLFENYAQPNHSLLTYHGFILENNPNDCALIEGLHIRRDDPGAVNVHLLRSMPSTFCIKGDVDSLQQLAYFLRVKHNLPNVSREIDKDIRPYLIEVFDQHISRLKDFIDLDVDPKEHNPRYHIHIMQQLVRNDLQHFEDAMKLVAP